MIPFKDMLIALSFTWLYYHQGMKKAGSHNKEEIDEDIQEIINFSKGQEEDHIDEDARSTKSILDEIPFVK